MLMEQKDITCLFGKNLLISRLEVREKKEMIAKSLNQAQLSKPDAHG